MLRNLFASFQRFTVPKSPATPVTSNPKPSLDCKVMYEGELLVVYQRGERLATFTSVTAAEGFLDALERRLA